MKEKKVNKSDKLSSNELNSVAGGRYNDLIVQQIVNMDGFDKKWINSNKNGWDHDFLAFLNQRYGKERADALVERYRTQSNMFEK